MEPNYSFDGKRLILVIETETEFCEKIRGALSEDFQIAISRGADEALAYIQKNVNQISLILLDIRTAGQNGIELLKTIKNDKALAHIPVIVLTEEKQYEVECLEIGASDFIQTPCDIPQVVLARVKRLIEDTDTAANRGSIDELTGLMNAETFYRCVEEHDQLYPDIRKDAVCVDISSFHIINDLFGREHGNRILVKIARELKRIAKRENGLVCRKSADVFLLYLPHHDEYQGLLDKMRESLTKKYNRNNIRLKLGIYPDVDKDLDIQSRFDRAKLARDTILYNYSQIIAYYDGEKYRKDLINQQLMRDIDAALIQRQFRVYYQPKFSIKGDTPELVSAEALVRWHHPMMGLLYPGSFVPVFEENGLISSLDRYVWEEAAAQIHRWYDKYGISFPVSVNVSRVDLTGTDLTSIFLLIAHKYEIDPGDMLIEITESACTENYEQLTEQLNNLRQEGFRVEMDDFGSGYSSLNMLSSIPIDTIKLDIDFIRNMFESEKNMQMLRLMMQIKDSLKIPIVAEGVETEEQLNLLKEIGCDIVQGYYFSKPVLPEEFEKFIEDKLQIPQFDPIPGEEPQSEEPQSEEPQIEGSPTEEEESEGSGEEPQIEEPEGTLPQEEKAQEQEPHNEG